MSQRQQYLANARRCALSAAASGPDARRQLERAEQAWLVLAGIEPALADPAATAAD